MSPVMPIELHTVLDNGTPVVLRPLQSDDEARLREGIARLSDRSRYLRFFTGARHLPDSVVRKLADADGVHHVAWGALDVSGDEPMAIGAAHAMREDDGPEAELAFAILDAYHSQGLARMLIAATLHDALGVGITRLKADVLSENTNAKRLLRGIGAKLTDSQGTIASYGLETEQGLARLRGMSGPPGLVDVFTGLDRAGRAAKRPAA